MDKKNIYKLKKIYDLIKKAKNILLVSHINPDEDTISSTCSISLLLDSLKKQHTSFCVNPINKLFLFIPNAYKITTNLKDFNKFDLIIVNDCGSIDRTGIKNLLYSKQKHQTIVEFDHHIKIDDYADIEIKITSMASTTELIYHFFTKNNIKITKNIANCLLTGILTDTSNFSHPITSVNTINIASKLIKKGAQFKKITSILNNNKNLSTMKLWGVALNNLKYNKKYKIAFSIFPYEDIKNIEPKNKIYNTIMNSLTNISKVNMAMLFKEQKIGQISVSVRSPSTSKINVAKFANYFGGGGHKKAAGFFIRAKIKKNTNHYYFE